jgi:nitrate reductase gamma subunit
MQPLQKPQAARMAALRRRGLKMEQWLAYAKGPLFIATFTFMLLGLGRLVFMEIFQMLKNWIGMRDKDVPWMKNIKTTVDWILPVGSIYKMKPLMAIPSFLFHIGLIVVPIFLAEHMLLWKAGLGLPFNLPSLGYATADFLTLMTIATCAILLVYRIFNGHARALSGFWDYALLVTLLVPFVSGYIVMHPSLLFTRMETMMLVHVLSGELVFLLIPFTKLAHVVLFPFTRLSSDFYWRFPAEGPDRAARALHGDNVRA